MYKAIFVINKRRYPKNIRIDLGLIFIPYIRNK